MSFTNFLLAKLHPDDLAILEPHFQTVDLSLHQIVGVRGSVARHVYFVLDGMLSMVSEYEAEREIEIGIVGREGFLDTALVFGDDIVAYKINVQVAGTALRISASEFQNAIRQSRTLHDSCLRFARALEIQIASTVSAGGRTNLEERLARWLLMVQDRLDTDTLEITHEFLAQMLCCRRPGVTVALHQLEGKNLVRSTRGRLTVLDRDGLIEEAKGSYGLAEKHYARLIGEDFRGRRGSANGHARMNLSLVRGPNK